MSKNKVNPISQPTVNLQDPVEFLDGNSTTIELRDIRALQTKNLESEIHSSAPPCSEAKNVHKIRTKKGWKRVFGIACALAIGICFQISNIIIKTLKTHHPLNLAFWRYSCYIFIITPYLLYMKIYKNVNLFSSIGMGNEPVRICGCCTGPVKLKNLINFFALSVLSTPIFILRYASLNYLTIADSTVITYSGPLFTIVFGHFFLKEKCGFVTIPISILILLGVVVVSRPTFLTGNQDMDDNILTGIGITLTSTLFAATVFVLLRYTRQVNFMVINFACAVSGLMIGGIVVWIVGVFKIPEGIQEIFLVLVLTLLSFMASCLLVVALKFEEAGTISIVRTVDVFYGFLLEFVWFSIVPDIYSIVGAIIVVTGVLLITFRSILSTLPKEHCLKKAFYFLLY